MYTQVKNFVCIISILLLAFLPISLLAQIKYTALIPDTDVAIAKDPNGNLRIAADNNSTELSKSFFKFGFNSMPKNAKVSSTSLRLYKLPNPNADAFSSQLVTVMKGSNNWTGNETSLNDPKLSWSIPSPSNKPIGRFEIKKSTEKLTIKLNLPKTLEYVSTFISSDGILSLAARSPQAEQDNKFYSTKTAETTGNYPNKPKLVVKYEIDPYPFQSDWAQAYASSQHNSYLNWSTNATVTSAKYTSLPQPSDDRYQIPQIGPTSALCIYNNQPVIFTQAATGTSNVFAVKQLDSKGNVLWSKGVSDIAKSWPVIDEDGRLYYFTRSGKMTILDLNNSGNVLYPEKTISKLTNNQISRINNNVTIGYDGTLYLVDDNAIVALSAYPQLKIRWKYDLSSSQLGGPVSLSPDESKAYFILVNKTQRTSQLVALDNMDGNELDKSGSVLGGYSSDNGSNYYIPAPVVQSNTKTFVLNGFDSGDKIMVFNLTNDKFGNTETISGSRCSQPVVDAASNVFFVYGQKIARYDNTQSNNVSVYIASAALNEGSILIASKTSEIYASDPYSTPKKVLGFKYNNGFQNTFSVNMPTTLKNIVLAPDGTLYTVTLTNLLAVTATGVSSNNLTIGTNNLKPNTLLRASNTITVSGIAMQSSINTVFHSGKTISFKKGFKIKKGASLICKTGY